MKNNYVHGYHERESVRLADQADCLSALLHHDSIFVENSLVLEAGCGTGAQTRIIAAQNPGSQFISIDISEASLRQAEQSVRSMNISNVQFRQGNIFELDFDDEMFDHIFICFVLEHLPKPKQALQALKRVLKKGGTLTLIEGDHGSAYFYPRSRAAQKAIDALVKLQALAGGNALIGRELYPLLMETGFKDCQVSPRMVYVDASRPEYVEGFTKNTFTAMIEGVREKVINANIINEQTFDKGVRDLYRSAEADGVFCYTFFKGSGRKT
ncbi:MAG: methyltransferase domain-containing protein [Calditrichaceae bacterium]|nr:methyltransferase domain-containing protein [Calditrichaceae bacterium]MBN2708688.1 methyltransferase domain-containing protein [Calditrichaceae bacterium]RQV92801.1 MAG: methyltransferase domain-containing protein [Calditrichota bacterium]